eukprot:15388930-Alexandrium_andersonii.AAC.1
MPGGASNGAQPADGARPACALPTTCRGGAPSSWRLPPTSPDAVTLTLPCSPRSTALARQLRTTTAGGPVP